MASTHKDEERRDHFWSRKPPEERRPLTDLSRLLFNPFEWQHPFKLIAAAFAVVLVCGMVLAALAVGGNGGDEGSNGGDNGGFNAEQSARVQRDPFAVRFCERAADVREAYDDDAVDSSEFRSGYVDPLVEGGFPNTIRDALPGGVEEMADLITGLPANKADGPGGIDDILEVCDGLGVRTG